MRKLVMIAAVLLAACAATNEPVMTKAPGMGSGAGPGSGIGSGSGGEGSGACEGSCENMIALDKSMFYDDGTRWWTLQSGPTLTGTAQLPDGSLQAYIAGAPIGQPVTLTATSWSLALPDGSIAATDTAVVLKLTYQGSVFTLTQPFALDSGHPAVAATSHVLDERADTISFASGDALHTHHGTPVNLAGTGCPDISMYAYLMSQAAPLFGGQTTPNPLAWQVQPSSPVGIDATASQFRVRADDGTELLAWTAMTPDATGAYDVALYSDGAHAIPKLATRDGGMFVDVQFADELGQATTQSYCVKYHPMAAPLEIQPIAKESGFEPLWSMSFAAGSPISDVLEVNANVPALFSQRIIQHAADSVVLDVAVTPPSGSWTKTIAELYVKTAGGSFDCGNSETKSTDQRCSQLTRTTGTTTPSSGALASGDWSTLVIDEATGAVASACTTSGLHSACTIPARVAGAAAHAYRVVTLGNDVTDLWPAAAGPFVDGSVSGETGVVHYTGIVEGPVSHCDTHSTVGSGLTAHTICSYSTYAHVLALDAASVAFAPFAISYEASLSPDLALAPLPYAASPFTSAAMTWNTGVAAL